MVKVSESRSTARRAILRKRAAVMPFLSQPTPQDSMPEAFPRMGNGRPVTDYDFHAYAAAHPYEFTLGPAGVPAGGPAVGQYAPAAAERQ